MAKDHSIYSPDKSLYAVAIGRSLFRYVRPATRYQRSEVLLVGEPVRMRSHADACRAADSWAEHGEMPRLS